MEAFGERLRYYRKRLGLSQTELADKLHVGQTTIANYERNKRFPNRETLVDLARELEISTDVLLGLDSQKTVDVRSQTVDYQTFFDTVKAQKFEQALQLAIQSVAHSNNVIDFLTHYIVPVMYQVGQLWELGQMSIENEHLISNQMIKIIHALSPYNTPTYTTDQKILLMAIEQEQHMMGLQIVAEVFRHYGWKTYFIGNSIPWNNIVDLIGRENIGHVAISMTYARNLNTVNALIAHIKQRGQIAVIIGGQAIINDPGLSEQLTADYYIRGNSDLVNYINVACHYCMH